MHRSKQREVPIWERSLLTINEASDYTGIGMNRLRSLTSKRDCDLVIFVGNRRMFKRKKLDKFLENATTI